MSRPSLDEIKQNLGDQRSWFWWPASSLASPAAFAQKDGASSQSNVGPGASEDAMKQGTTTGETGTTSRVPLAPAADLQPAETPAPPTHRPQHPLTIRALPRDLVPQRTA
jgi:hypothetical protein